jgi:hypothetical protein
VRRNTVSRLGLAAFLALSVAAAAPLPLRATDPFYLELLRTGLFAYNRKEYVLAARNLRLACFGMLDEPKTLAACLVRLALAQDKAADKNGFRESFRRLVEIEERFQAYSQADLPAEVRAALEQRLPALIPAATLAGAPAAFRPSAGGKADHGKREDTAQSKTPPPRRPGPPGAAPAPDSAPAGPEASAAPLSLTAEENGKLTRAKELLQGQSGTAKELGEALSLARQVADAHPDSIAAQRVAGEASYRVSRWADCVRYLKRGNLPDSEPELLFYLAVALYESGDTTEAADTLRRSLPNLQRSAYVDAYARKILGE